MLATTEMTAALLAAGLILASPVFAHDDLDKAFAECTCVTRHVEPPDPLARFTRVDGHVFATTLTGYRTATVGMTLDEGNEVTTGATGKAQVLVGKRCRIDIEPNRQLTISRPAGPTHNTCVTLYPLEPAGLAGSIKVGIAIKALVGFGLTGVILSGGDDPASD